MPFLPGTSRPHAIRAQASCGPLLILQDTTEFSYKRDKPELVGFKGVTHSRRDEAGRPRAHTTCGILMHSSLAVTAQGLPLGLCAVKFWSRQKFKGTSALKNKINPTRVPIGDHTIADEMAEVRVQGLHCVEFRDERGQPCEATLEISYRRIGVLPPIGKQKLYPPLELTVLHAQERDAPADRAALQWKLIANLPVRSKAAAIEKIDWYAMRWKIGRSRRSTRS